MADYQPNWLAKLFHSFPRLDLTFLPVNSTFKPFDAQYRESLIIWAAVPVLWLVLTLLVFLFYFCVRCCQRDVEKRQRVPCLRWTMAILALFTCGIIGMGFYGNQECKKGIDTFVTAAVDAETTDVRLKVQVERLQRVVEDKVDTNIKSMKSVFSDHPDLTDPQKDDLDRITQKCEQHTRSIVQNAYNIQERSEQVTIGKDTEKYTRLFEFYFWLGVLVMLACFILLCLNLLLGIGRSSKCILLLFCALGIISLVVCWIAAGIFFGTSVGVSDFCMDPNSFFEKVLYERTRIPGKGDYTNLEVITPLQRDVMRYYINCETRTAANPFKDQLRDAQDSVRQANNTINRAINVAVTNVDRSEMKEYTDKVSAGLDEAVDILLHLTALVECTNLHKDYTIALKGICHTALPGLAFMLLATVLTGLLFTLLVLMASRAWRHFTRRKGYQEVDEDDPFLPRPDPNSPSYYSFTRQGPRGNPRAAAAAGGGEQITMQRRNTPPPAYNSYEQRGPPGMIRPPQAPVVPPDDEEYFGRETYA